MQTIQEKIVFWVSLCHLIELKQIKTFELIIFKREEIFHLNEINCQIEKNMKTSHVFSLFLLTTICLNSNAQNSTDFPTDSLMKNIVSYLNDHEFHFYLDDRIKENGEGQPRIEVKGEISYSGDSLVFNTDEGRKTACMSQYITLRDESAGNPNRKGINVGVYLWIVKPLKNYTQGTKKRAEYDQEAKKQTIELYELMFPFSKKFESAQIANENAKIAKDLEDFQRVVDEYNKLPEKQTMTEEQRKYVVQANALNEEMNYGKALEAYDKVIKINPVSYPAAYYNMALITVAWVKDYKSAISYMKKYLILLPDAPDARAAQDKIYEWELKIGK